MDIKEELLEIISQIHDQDKLREILDFMLKYLNDVDDSEENSNEIYEFSEQEAILISEALENVKRGEVISHDEVVRLSETWLNS